jgi:hypothetical protein
MDEIKFSQQDLKDAFNAGLKIERKIADATGMSMFKSCKCEQCMKKRMDAFNEFILEIAEKHRMNVRRVVGSIEEVEIM